MYGQSRPESNLSWWRDGWWHRQQCVENGNFAHALPVLVTPIFNLAFFFLNFMFVVGASFRDLLRRYIWKLPPFRQQLHFFWRSALYVPSLMVHCG